MVQSLRCVKALSLLTRHHSRPIYTKGTPAFQRILALNYQRMAWGDRHSWSQNSNRRSRQRRPSDGKDKEKTKVEKFPAYDRGTTSASTSSGSAPPQSQDAVVQALLTLASKDKNLASAVETLIPQEAEDQHLKVQQQVLNKIRKVRQKIARKEAAISTKGEQMKAFLEEMKKHIAAERHRHQEETEELQKELVDLREELELLKQGKEKPTDPEVSLESLLSEDEAMDGGGEKELLKQLAVAQQEAKEAQNLAYAMQAQVSAFLQYQQLAAGSTAPLEMPTGLAGEVFSPQKPKPPTLNGSSVERNVKAPFGVMKKETPEQRGSPYVRPGQAAAAAEGKNVGSSPTGQDVFVEAFAKTMD